MNMRTSGPQIGYDDNEYLRPGSCSIETGCKRKTRGKYKDVLSTFSYMEKTRVVDLLIGFDVDLLFGKASMKSWIYQMFRGFIIFQEKHAVHSICFLTGKHMNKHITTSL